jgi:hypothetical protein
MFLSLDMAIRLCVYVLCEVVNILRCLHGALSKVFMPSPAEFSFLSFFFSIELVTS